MRGELPTDMRAAVFRGGTDIRIARAPLPVTGPGDVLIRIGAAGICGSDVLSYRGLGPWQHSPDNPDGDGHEFSGVVASVGDDVVGIAPGDRVAVEPIHLSRCGSCEHCVSGRTHLCASRGVVAGIHRHSRGFAEFDVAPAGHVYRLPDHVGLEAASLLDCYACGVHALHVEPIAPAEPVLIVGSGAIGLTLGQVARAAGHNVTMFGRRRRSLELAREAGAADAVFHTADPSERERAVRAAGDFPVVFDAAGNADTSLSDALDFVQPGGRVVVVGVYANAPRFDPDLAYRREVGIRWSNSYGHCAGGVADFQLALDLLSDAAVDAPALITHRFALDQIVRGFEVMLDRAEEPVKVLVTVDADLR